MARFLLQRGFWTGRRAARLGFLLYLALLAVLLACVYHGVKALQAC